MESTKPILKITTEQWHARKKYGAAVVIDDRPFVVLTDESTHEPIYQPVSIFRCGNSSFPGRDGLAAVTGRREAEPLGREEPPAAQSRNRC